MTLYRHVPVYRRVENGIAVYHVFEVIGLGYVVQSQDFIYADSTAEHERMLQRQFIELLIDEAPELRSQPASSIEAAIQAFDAEFPDDVGDSMRSAT